MRRILRAAPFRRTLCATVIASLGIPALAQQLAGSRFEEEFLGIGGGKQPRADLSISPIPGGAGPWLGRRSRVN